MDNLMMLYRYLVQNKARAGQESNAYTRAYEALDHVLEMLRNLEYRGQHIRDTGGMTWEEADQLTDRLIDAHKVALIEHLNHETPLDALVDFSKWLNVKDYDVLIKLLQAQREQREHEAAHSQEE